MYPITLFYLVLLFWEFLQSIAWLLSIQWIHQGAVVMGTCCVTQGILRVSFLSHLDIEILVAILKQLDATGTALSIMGMSWCILHDYVLATATNLSFKSGCIGLAIMFIIQAILIGVPNGIYHGAFNYYGPAG